MEREDIMRYAAKWADSPAIDYISALEIAIAEQERIEKLMDEDREKGDPDIFWLENEAYAVRMQMIWTLSVVYGIDFDTVLAHVQG